MPLSLPVDRPANAKPKVKLKLIGRFKKPVYVTSAPGVRGIFVVEQGEADPTAAGKEAPHLPEDRRTRAIGWGAGLLSVTFAPDYATSRLLYVYFNDNSGDIEIAELRAIRTACTRRGARSARSSSSCTP